MEPKNEVYDNFDEMLPSYADLPMEIILNIFRYLSFGDIQMASLTCHRWLEATFEFHFKAQLKFSKICVSDNSQPGQLFTKTFRPFNNLYLDETVLGQYEIFFQQLGKTLESITFLSTDLTDKQFCSIIKEIKNLRELTIAKCSSLFMAGQFLESPEDRTSIQEQMSSVTSLSLRINSYLSDAILLRLTSLIPHLEKLDMGGCHIAYHNAIQRRFYPPDLENTPSESILTFKFLLKVIEMHAKSLKELDLSNTLVGGPALSSLAEIESLNLQRITFNFCRQLNFTGLNTLAEHQKNLVELNISSSDGITDSCVELLAENLSALEIFRLKRCRKLTNASAIAISKLKCLKVLDLSHCDGISSDGIQEGLARVKNEILLELYLISIDLCEACIIQCSENLPNLRVLDIGNCINGVTDRAVQAIIKNLIWLRILDLEGCVLITDAAITGIDVKSQLMQDNLDGSILTTNSSSVDSFHHLNFNRSYINSPNNLPIEGNSTGNVKISLRSKAEEEIVQDAERKKAMLAIYEMNLINDSNREGLSIKGLKGLQSLNLQGCTKISDVSLKYGLKFLELRRLLLSNCQQISVTGMEALVENCPAIEDLDLSDCYNINDKVIEIITLRLKRLKNLNISGCAQLTDHSLDSIVVNCKVLQSISLNRCRRMCSDLDVLQSNIPSLRTITIDRPPTIDNADIFRLKKRLDY